MANVTVDLDDPIEGHEGLIKQVVLREPRMGDLIDLGEPYAHGYSKKGDVVYTAENTDVIKGYIERVLVSPNALLLNQLSLADAMKVKGRVLDFFSAARGKRSSGTAIS